MITSRAGGSGLSTVRDAGTRPLARLLESTWGVGVAGLAALYAGLFTFLAFRQHAVFAEGAFDMGNMDQAVWNTIHGRLLAFTNMAGVTTRLAIHVEPTLALISPIYLLWSDPRALMLLQSVALGTGALPLFWIARRELRSGAAGFAVAASYLLFPSLEGVNRAEFHAVALSAPLLLWAFYFAGEERWPAYLAASILAAGTKEEVGLVVAAMGIYLAVQKRSIASAMVAALGVTWSLVAVLVVIPAFNPARVSPYSSYYSYLGPDLFAAAVQLLTHPWIAVDRALSNQEYLKSLLQPTAYLALLSPARLAIGLTSFLINVLSDDSFMSRPNMFHYTAALIPGIMLAAISGARRLSRLLEFVGVRRGVALAAVAVLLLTFSSVYHRSEGFTPLSEEFSVPEITEHDRLGYRVLAMVPEDAALSVQSELNPHLSEREKLYVFPDGIYEADYILVDQARDSGAIVPVERRNSPGYKYRLEHLKEVLSSGEFDVIFDEDDYLLLKRRSR